MRSIIQHLRFPFSYLLLPVYLLALVFVSVEQADAIWSANNVLIFVILHILVYPASNAYNSLNDVDTGSIGLIKTPSAPSTSLAWISMAMDLLALLLACWISLLTAILLLGYILISRLYSYRRIRLKKYPVLGFLTVFLFQGAWIFLLTYYSLGGKALTTFQISLVGLAASSLIGAVYPLSQIYQHEQDKADHVITISMILGYRGTFIFSALFFSLGSILFLFAANEILDQSLLLSYLITQTPSLIYFNYWFFRVMQNQQHADFVNTMRMNLISATCMNAFFIYVLVQMLS